MFWFKPRKIHVDCFVKNETIATVNPIQKAHHFVPDWWKKLDNFVFNINSYGMKVPRPTMKKCAGFVDLYRTGLIVPMWCDLSIEVHGENYRYHSAIPDLNSGNESAVISHPTFQHNNSFDGLVNIKIVSPWVIRENTGVKFLYAPCTWSTVKKFPKVQFLSGILDFKNQFEAHIQSFVPSEQDQYRIDIEAGTPLMHIIPLSEKKVIPHIHFVDKVEFEKLKTFGSSYKFVGSYINRVRSSKLKIK